MCKNGYLIILLILIPFLSILGQSDWNWQNPLPQGNSLEGVKMLDPNTIIAAGDVSTIIQSTNSGISWNLQHRVNNSELKFTSLYFLNSKIGWATSGYNVYKTTDAGISWIPDSIDFQVSFNDVYFLDENTGWAVGTAGNV